MLDAVIFDWGGVVAEDPAGPLMRYSAAALHVPVSAFRRAFDLHGLAFQSGKIDEDLFWSLVCKELGLEAPMRTGSLWGQAFRTVYRQRPAMLLLIDRLRLSGLKTCLLSNTEPPCVDFFRSLGYRCFDQAVFSCQVGMIKPAPAIYRLTLDRLHCLPTRVLFIDDRPSFVRAARSVGLHAGQYQGMTWLRGLLEEHGLRI